VEVAAPMVVVPEERFEIELRNGRQVRVAARFEPEALRALLAVLESA
jgi:hypothetical protein